MKKLRQEYEACCQEYRRLFCKFLEVDIRDSFWVADQVGGMLDLACGGWDVSMEDIKYVIDSHDADDVPEKPIAGVLLQKHEDGSKSRIPVTWSEFNEWYDYCAATYKVEYIPRINLHSWHMGCPHLTPSQLREVDDVYSEIFFMECSTDSDDIEGQREIESRRLLLKSKCDEFVGGMVIPSVHNKC